ncbi:hypothetical protein GCM10022226_39180 [Sphaerisporangium flaviroseum]|uniref:Cytochrome P450 n=1 Tax=Sphaerisporangium flaviroseum TaxID=509199 RepID=A0ABP7IBW8_9ACTN
MPVGRLTSPSRYPGAGGRDRDGRRQVDRPSMEMRIGFRALLQRFPELRLTVPDTEPAFRDQMEVYGVLPVTW